MGRLLSKEEKERVRSAIEAAGSVEEVSTLFFLILLHLLFRFRFVANYLLAF